MSILDKLSIGDEFELHGQKYMVTEKSRGYKIGCMDQEGIIHYFIRETPILKIIKRGEHANNKN